MMKKILYFIIFLITINAAMAILDFDECDRFDTTYCIFDDWSHYACQGGGYACKGPDHGNLNWLGNRIWDIEYYCDIGDSTPGYTKCEDGCNYATGLCQEGYRQCSEDFMECRYGNPYKCINNEWIRQDVCQSDESCIEETYSRAWCKQDMKYCLSRLKDKCTMASSGSNLDCYDTSFECQNNIKYVCLMNDKSTCKEKSKDLCEVGWQMVVAPSYNEAIEKCWNMVENQDVIDDNIFRSILDFFGIDQSVYDGLEIGAKILLIVSIVIIIFAAISIIAPLLRWGVGRIKG
jgi:hypothetical protein